MAFVYLGFPLTIGACFIVIEISTPFVCGRWLFFHHGMKDSMLQVVNSVFLATTFIAGRCFFQLYIILWFACDWIYNLLVVQEGVPLLYQIIVIEMALATTIAVILNLYWSWLIIKQLIRILQRKPETSFTGTVEDNERQKKLEMNKMLDPE